MEQQNTIENYNMDYSKDNQKLSMLEDLALKLLMYKKFRLPRKEKKRLNKSLIDFIRKMNSQTLKNLNKYER